MKKKNSAHSGKERLLHILMGCIIMVHGIERLDKHFYSGLIFVIAGIVFLSCALFHKQLIKGFRYIDSLFHCLEAMLCIVIAVEYFGAGKQYIPWFYMVAAVMYFVAAGFQWKRSKKNLSQILPQ